MSSYKRLEDLVVYQKVCQLHIEVCALTHNWPREEKYELGSQASRAPGALTLAGSNRSETSGGSCALVSSAAARRRFPQARLGSPANRLRHSISPDSGYTQLPVIRKGNIRKLAGGSDPADVEPPAAQSGARSPHSKVARSMRRRWETQLGDRDSEFPAHSLRRRSLRQGLRRSLRRGLSRKQLSASLCRKLRRELCRINTSRKVCLTVQQNSLDIDSIARKPVLEAKFQVSQAPGALRLAGSNRSETSGRGPHLRSSSAMAALS